jgi:hypothetical protein
LFNITRILRESKAILPLIEKFLFYYLQEEDLAQKLLYFLTLLPDQEFEMDGKWK